MKHEESKWPRCPVCGGPARPKGKPGFSLVFEVETVSEANRRDTWGKVKRKAEQKDKTIEEVSVALGAGQTVPRYGPWFVLLTRVAPDRIDKDNLPRSLKAIQDAVAAVIGIDDGSL